MATLNQLSSRIVNMIGQPDNHELRERVKDMFKNNGHIISEKERLEYINIYCSSELRKVIEI